MTASHSRLVRVELPEADLLADYYGIRHDLALADRLCDGAVKIYHAEGRREIEMEEALVTAAVIRYGRCFMPAVRVHLGKSDLQELSKDQLAAHEEVMALRNWYVAHSISNLEESYVNVQATLRGEEMVPVTSVSFGQTRTMLTTEMTPRIKVAIKAAHAVLTPLIERETEKVLQAVQAVPLEVVHSWDMYRFPKKTSSNTKRSRARNAPKRKARGKRGSGEEG